MSSAAIQFSQCLSDVATPLQLFHSLSDSCEHAILLESTDADTRLARFSFIAWQPECVFIVKNGHATLEHRSGEIESFPCTDPWGTMRDHQKNWLEAHGLTEAKLAPYTTSLPALGGWFGVSGYAAVRYNEAIPMQVDDTLDVPDIAYGFYPQLLCFDHLKRTLTLVSLGPDEAAHAARWQAVRRAIEAPRALPQIPVKPYDEEDAPLSVFKEVVTNISQQAYLDKVAACKQLVAEGEAFQIVLAQRFSTPFPTAQALSAYRTLIATNPSPYAYVLKFPDFYYLGSSPETFVELEGDTVTLRALAGTRKRGKTQAEDEAMAAELRADEKELAEHKMLVDLARNDLGRLCEVGSIRVGALAELHYYTHVMHLATEVSGKRQPGRDAFDIFRTVLPRGTVSGAPKIRAMQHLSQLEPEQRGFYAGAVGYFDVSGRLNSCIAIRSALLKADEAHVHAGAGVVYDSRPELEYLETRNKAQSVLTALHWAKVML